MGTEPQRVQAVIFDLDDTLVDHLGAARAGFVSWLGEQSVEPSQALVDHWFDAEARHFGSYSRGEIDLWEQRRRRVRETLVLLALPVGSDQELNDSFQRYLDFYAHAWRVFDDVGETLALLEDRGLRVAILTNGVEFMQRQKLEATGLTGRVGPMLCADTVGHSKPAPEAFLAACGAARVEPAATLFVGDHYDLDFLGARAAGLLAVHLDRHGSRPDRDPQRISTLRELSRFV